MKFNSKIKILLVALIVFFGTVSPTLSAFSFRDSSLKFVHVTDTHISDREDTSYKMLSQSKNLLADFIKGVNKIQSVDFVIFTGDMVDRPQLNSYKDFFTILTALKYPSLMTFGNHDAKFAGGENEEYLTEEQVLRIISDCNPNQKFDKTYWAITPKANFRMIVLNTRTEEKSSNGVISKEQLEFLASELEANKDKVVLIFAHHPVVEPFQSETHKVLNSEEIMTLLQQYKNPIAYFSGHYHTTKITKLENLIFVSTPALATYPNAYRLVNITDYKDRTIFDFYFNETGLKDVQAQAKANAIATATFYGTEKDRATTIIIKK